MLDIYPDSNAIFIEDNIGWFVSRVNNVLCQIDMVNRECTFLATLPESGTKYWRGNNLCCKLGDEIVCLPNRSSYIRIYNLKVNKFTSIRMPKGIERWGIVAYIVKNKIVYMISAIQKIIIAADIEKLKIIKIVNVNKKHDINSISGVSIYKSDIYFIGNGNETAIYQYNVDSEDISRCFGISEKDQYSCILFDGLNFWLSGHKKEILVINKESYKQTKLFFKPKLTNFVQYNFRMSDYENENLLVSDDEDYADGLFSFIFMFRNKIWLFPNGASHIIYVDLNNYDIVPIEIANEVETIESIKNRDNLSKYKYLLHGIENDKNLIIYSLKNKCHYVIDGDTGKCLDSFKDYNMVNYNKLLEHLSNNTKNTIYYEGNLTDKELYTFEICRASVKNEDINIIDFGNRIYKYN